MEPELPENREAEENDIYQGEWPPTAGGPAGRGFASSATALTLVLVLIIAAGAGLRLFRLGQKSLWVDEAISCALASTGHDPVELPPLYFRLLGLTMELAGSEEEWALRLLSALCGIAAIPLVFLLGREADDRWTGAAAALILALSPYHVQISQEARNYALLSLLALLFFLLQTVARRRRGAISVLAWAASAPGTGRGPLHPPPGRAADPGHSPAPAGRGSVPPPPGPGVLGRRPGPGNADLPAPVAAHH